MPSFVLLLLKDVFSETCKQLIMFTMYPELERGAANADGDGVDRRIRRIAHHSTDARREGIDAKERSDAELGTQIRGGDTCAVDIGSLAVGMVAVAFRRIL